MTRAHPQGGAVVPAGRGGGEPRHRAPARGRHPHARQRQCGRDQCAAHPGQGRRPQRARHRPGQGMARERLGGAPRPADAPAGAAGPRGLERAGVRAGGHARAHLPGVVRVPGRQGRGDLRRRAARDQRHAAAHVPGHLPPHGDARRLRGPGQHARCARGGGGHRAWAPRTWSRAHRSSPSRSPRRSWCSTPTAATSRACARVPSRARGGCGCCGRGTRPDGARPQDRTPQRSAAGRAGVRTARGRAISFGRGPRARTQGQPQRGVEGRRGAEGARGDARSGAQPRLPASAHAGEPLDARTIRRQLDGRRARAGDSSSRPPGRSTRPTQRSWSAPVPPPGTSEVLLAECQSAGRGRRGRTWLAPPGGAICLSLSWTFPEVPRGPGRPRASSSACACCARSQGSGLQGVAAQVAERSAGAAVRSSGACSSSCARRPRVRRSW